MYQNHEFRCTEAWHLNFRYRAIKRESIIAESMTLAIMADLVLEDLNSHMNRHGCGVQIPTVTAESKPVPGVISYLAYPGRLH